MDIVNDIDDGTFKEFKIDILEKSDTKILKVEAYDILLYFEGYALSAIDSLKTLKYLNECRILAWDRRLKIVDLKLEIKQLKKQIKKLSK